MVFTRDVNAGEGTLPGGGCPYLWSLSLRLALLWKVEPSTQIPLDHLLVFLESLGVVFDDFRLVLSLRIANRRSRFVEFCQRLLKRLLSWGPPIHELRAGGRACQQECDGGGSCDLPIHDSCPENHGVQPRTLSIACIG